MFHEQKKKKNGEIQNWAASLSVKLQNNLGLQLLLWWTQISVWKEMNEFVINTQTDISPPKTQNTKTVLSLMEVAVVLYVKYIYACVILFLAKLYYCFIGL